MAQIFRDLRYTLRALRKRPGFVFVVTLSVTLGISAACVTLRMADRLLLHPLEVRHANRLAEMKLHWDGKNEDRALSYPAYQSYARSDAIQGLAVFASVPAVLEDSGEQLTGMLISPGFFPLLGVEPIYGRSLVDGEADAPLVILSWDLWKRQFDGDPGAINSLLRLNGESYTIVGVAPRSFRGLRLVEPIDFWLPVENLPRIATGFMAQIPVLELPGVGWLGAVALLPDQIKTSAAAEALTGLARRVEPGNAKDLSQLRVALTPLAVFALGRDGRDEIRSLLFLLGVLVALEILITCSNLAGMFFSRGLQEHRAWAIHLSLGAPRRSFSRRLIFEAMLLSTTGTTLGLLTSNAILNFTGKLPLSGMQVLGAGGLELTPAYVVVAYVCSFLVAALISLPVGWGYRQMQLTEALKDSAPRKGSSRFDLRRAVIFAEVAVAVILFSGVALFSRSLANAWAVDPGFRTEDITTTSLNLGLHDYDEPRARNFLAGLKKDLALNPGVSSASWTSTRPLGEGIIRMGFEIPDRPRIDDKEFEAPAVFVSPGFFRTLDLSIEEGRSLTLADRQDAPTVAIVSRAFVRRYLPGARPVGQNIRLSGNDVEIVGVSADIKLVHLNEDPQPVLYLPMSQHFGLVGLRRIHLLARSNGPQTALISTIRERIKARDPLVSINSVEGLQENLGRRLLPQKIGAWILGFLSLFAIVMVAAGVYGILAGFVLQNTREIGIRIAVGASRLRVIQIVAAKVLLPVLGGLMLGLVLATLLLGTVSSLLFEVNPTDPLSLLAASLFLLVVAALATFLPATRAARIPPGQSLRTN